MELYQNLSTQLSQRLTLSHEMLQSLEIIQLPLLELIDKIDKELAENPALEIDEAKFNKQKSEHDIETIENVFAGDNNLFLDSSSADVDIGVNPSTKDIDTKREFLENAITIKSSLEDHLLWQLGVLNLNDKEREIGKTIITLLDSDGFFKYDLNEIFNKKDVKVAKDVLDTIQTFDPIGIASKDVRDALLFQLESYPENKLNRNAYIIVNEMFDLMIARKDSVIAKNLGIKKSEVQEAFDFLSQFNPYPGREFSSEQVKFIIPDAFVYKRDGEIIVEINKEFLPPLTVSKYMEKISKNVKHKKVLDGQYKYAVDKIMQAKKFIYTVRHRNESLFKLVLCIVKDQSQFFESGPKFLKPLTMGNVSEKIGLSESTISRLASSKYIQTEWGIREIKYFFQNSIDKSGDNDRSSESIRELIKEILQNAEEKITDQKISDILKNKGISIARRTVAKYRKQLDILPSHYRKF